MKYPFMELTKYKFCYEVSGWRNISCHGDACPTAASDGDPPSCGAFTRNSPHPHLHFVQKRHVFYMSNC